MANHNRLGSEGERIATEYLLADGYTIHRTDERVRHRGEIDIIAFKDNEVVFVEVKTRSEEDTDPMEVVDARRRARICRAADSFIERLQIDLLPRFDIIIINMAPDGSHHLTHYPDAFIPPLNATRRY
ncbi:MAG: YraN family protein [Bacteroides sp.]|nr:YraN family protein [Bacteroides sp.]